MGILNDIRNATAKSGGSKRKIIYFRDGSKTRVRFLSDMDDGTKITFHDSFEQGINCPCREQYGEECPYCGVEGLRTRDQYAWSVWDYDSNEVKLLVAAVNNCSPIPSMIAMFDVYNTLTDRDYVVARNGKQQNTTYSVVPMDKVKFRNDRAKALTDSKVLEIINEAYPYEGEVKPSTSKTSRLMNEINKEEEKPKTKHTAKKNEEDDSDLPFTMQDDEFEKMANAQEETEEADDFEPIIDYSEMSAKELYAMCKKRNIEAEPKKPIDYYVNLLEEADEAEEWNI